MVGSSKVKKVASDAVAFLEVLDTAGVVADLTNQVVDQSSKAKDIGLVEYDKVISPELVELMTQARVTRQSVSQELYFAKNNRSPKYVYFSKSDIAF